MIFGTCHFVSRTAAINYYRSQGHQDAAKAVDSALREERIKIGCPTHLESQHRLTVNSEGRYVASSLSE